MCIGPRGRPSTVSDRAMGSGQAAGDPRRRSRAAANAGVRRILSEVRLGSPPTWPLVQIRALQRRCVPGLVADVGARLDAPAVRRLHVNVLVTTVALDAAR